MDNSPENIPMLRSHSVENVAKIKDALSPDQLSLMHESLGYNLYNNPILKGDEKKLARVKALKELIDKALS